MLLMIFHDFSNIIIVVPNKFELNIQYNFQPLDIGTIVICKATSVKPFRLKVTKIRYFGM